MTHENDFARIRRLPCWEGELVVAPLSGGMTNRNYLVADERGKHVARLGEDIAHHGVFRWHEQAVARAAHAAGLSPEIEFAAPGVVVMRFIEGRTLTPSDVRDPKRIGEIARLLRQCHSELPRHLSGATLSFCPFATVRRYADELRAAQSPRLSHVSELLQLNEELARQIQTSEVRFGHNDLLAGNFIDDGRRLWLIDWDYAAFSSPLFDLANLASNNEINGESESVLLQAYFAERLTEALVADYRAMRVASLLRECFWGMVSELHPTLQDFDYAQYTRGVMDQLGAEIARRSRDV